MKTKRKFRFEMFGKEVIAGVNDSVNVFDDVIKIRKYQKGDIIDLLWYTINNSVWLCLEKGQRIPGGKMRNDFEII